jgi:hypothetical protein
MPWLLVGAPDVPVRSLFEAVLTWLGASGIEADWRH